jgi:hypothetical protein
MNRIFIILILLLLIGNELASQVQITLTIPRLNSPYLSDYLGYESSQILILTNSSPERRTIYLRGKIEQLSRPGYYLRTKRNFRPAVPITLEPFETRTLFATAGDFGFLERNNLEDNIPDRIKRAIQLNGILPEGDYQICVEAVDFNTDQLVSSPEPAGCQFFNVTLGSPPQIINPICNDTILNLFPNFMWTPAISTVPLGVIGYTLYIVEYNSRALNPNEMMEQSIDYNAGNPIVIRRLLMNSYPYSPTDIPLKPNTTYIACVVASDVRSGAMFENQGRSEICIFYTGGSSRPDLGPVIIPTPTPQPGLAGVDLPSYLTRPNLKGQLRYYWNVSGGATAFNNRGELVGSAISSSISGRIADRIGGGESSGNRGQYGDYGLRGSMSHFLGGLGGSGQGATSWQNNIGQAENMALNTGIQIQAIPLSETIYHSTVLNTTGYDGFVNSALAGVNVSLILGRQVRTNYTCANLAMVESDILPEGPVLATAVTGSDGSFSFNLPLGQHLDFSWQEANWPSSDVCHGSTNYQFRNVLLVKLSGNHAPYSHPIQAIAGIPDDGEMGAFYSLVRTYDMEIELKERNNVANSPTFSQFEALLIRNTPVNNIYPRDAFSPGKFQDKEEIGISGINYKIYSKSNPTGGQSRGFIRNIPWANCPDTRFNIFVRPYDEYGVTMNITNSPSPMYMVIKNNYDQCHTNNNYNNNLSCVLGVCSSVTNNYSSKNPENIPTYYHRQLLILGPPRIYGRVINEAASGDMSDLARAEPGVNFRIWAIGYHGMNRLKTIYGNEWPEWVSHRGTNMNSFMNLANNGLNIVHQNSNLTSGMKIAYSGVTGNDGRIDRQVWTWLLSSNQAGSRFDGKKMGEQVGFCYFVDIAKDGFRPQKATVLPLDTINPETGKIAYMQRGQAFNVGELWLKPRGQVELYFRDRKEANVRVKQVYYIDEETGQAGIVKSSSRQMIAGLGFRQVVNLNVPSGQVKIVVVPEYEEDYVRDTITLQVPETGVLKREVIVPFKLHRLRFIVRNENGQPIQHVRIRLQNANAEFVHSENCIPSGLPIQNTPYLWPHLLQENDKTTNSLGMACVAFKNAGTDFSFRITGPPNQDYIVTNKSVQSQAGKRWINVDVVLKEGRTVRGKVSFNDAPVANARVRIKNSNPVVEVFTDEDGNYEMRGVPKDTILTFTASKSGFVGAEFTEGSNSSNWRARILLQYLNNNTTVINFNLNVYGGLDLSQILGYDVEITSLKENTEGADLEYEEEMSSGYQNTGIVEVSGILDLSTNTDPIFKIEETNANDQHLENIEFSNLKLIPDPDLINEGGIPFGKPEIMPMETDINTIKLKIFDNYHANYGDNSHGVVVNSVSGFLGNKGFVQGKANLSLNSFTAQLLELPDNQRIHLKHSSSSIPHTNIPVYPAGGNNIFNASQGIQVSDQNGNNILYNYGGIDCIASENNSRLYIDSLSFDTRLQTDWQHVQGANINLAIGPVSFVPGGSILSINRTVSKTTVLAGDFNFEWERIALNTSGVRFGGLLKLRGVELPVSNAVMLPDRFSLPSQALQVDNISLMGVVPLEIASGSNVDFGFDAFDRNAWYLNIYKNDAVAAILRGEYLTGLGGDNQIKINSIWLYSNGIENVNLHNQNIIKLKNIAEATVHNLFMAPNSFKLQVSLDLGLPSFETISTDLFFGKNTQSNTLNHYIIETRAMPNRTINNLTFGFHPSDYTIQGTTNSIVITEGKLEVKGTISNPNKDIFKDLKCTITKVQNFINLDINEDVPQIMHLGGSANSDLVVSFLKGNMTVKDAAWEMLYLVGDMPESMGFSAENKTMRYDVEGIGALTVTEQDIRIQDTGGNFGGLNMHYDMVNHRLMGNIAFNEMIGTIQAYGDLELVFDKYGFYFMGHGGFVLNDPPAQGQAYFIFGSYDHIKSDRKSTIENALKSSSYYYQNLGKLPPGFTRMNRIQGFYLSAGAMIPMPGVPSFDLNVGIARARLRVSIGGEVRVGLQFGNSNMYNLGLGVFLDAEIGVGASAVVYCQGVNIRGKVGLDFDGTYWSNGNWAVDATGFFSLEGCAYFGGGLFCDADCDGACVSTEFCGSVLFTITGQLSNSGSNWSVNFSSDNTSEN